MSLPPVYCRTPEVPSTPDLLQSMTNLMPWADVQVPETPNIESAEAQPPAKTMSSFPQVPSRRRYTPIRELPPAQQDHLRQIWRQKNHKRKQELQELRRLRRKNTHRQLVSETLLGQIQKDIEATQQAHTQILAKLEWLEKAIPQLANPRK